MEHLPVRRLALGVALFLLAALLAGCGSSGEGSGGTAAAFAAGDTVAATWTDGNYYLATVKSVDGDTVNVVYADDGSSGAVATGEVRAIPPASFEVGDEVLAVWTKGRFYAGKVSEVDGSSYVIAWDDGTSPSTVESGKIISR